MPHREVLGSVDLTSFHRGFEPRALHEERLVSKLLSAFLSTDGNALIVEAMVVEGHLRQGFFLLATTKDGTAMVRVHPRSAPEKTPGVKRTVSWLAAWLGHRTGDAAVGKTNREASALAAFPDDAIR